MSRFEQLHDPTPSQVMYEMNAEPLKKIAKLLGIKNVIRKAEVIGALAECIHKQLPHLLEHCSKLDRLVLAEAAHGGPVDPRAFWGKYGVECPSGPGRDYGWKETPSPFVLLVWSDPSGRLQLARSLEARLQAILPAPKEVVIETVKEGLSDMHRGRTIHVYEGERVVFHELRRVLGLAQAGKLAVTAKRGTPTDACVRRIGEALMLPDLDLEEPGRLGTEWYTQAGSVRANAWGVLVQQCGWCKPAGSKLGLTRKGRAMLTAGDVGLLREGFARMLNDNGFDELNRISHIRGQTGKGKRSLTPPSDRRLPIASSMEGWPVGEWIPFDEVFRFVCSSGNVFSVSRNEWDLYLCDKQYGSLGYDYGDAGGGLERQYLRAFLMETLATLGLVDLAYVHPHGLWPEFSGAWGSDGLAFCGRYDGLLHVRLTALGAFCMGIAETYDMPAVESAGLVKVLPNLELVLMEDAASTPAEAARLELFASANTKHVWRIDPKRILEHLETGGSMEDIRRELASVAANEIPQTVTTLLDEMARKATALKGGQPSILIEVTDAPTAALIAHDPGARKHCIAAGDRHLVVLKRNERAFRGAVKKMGYVLPR